MSTHPLDKFFSEKLSRYEEKPSEKAWNSVRQALNTKKVALGSSVVWFRVAATVTLFALVGGTIYMIQQPTSADYASVATSNTSILVHPTQSDETTTKIAHVSKGETEDNQSIQSAVHTRTFLASADDPVMKERREMNAKDAADIETIAVNDRHAEITIRRSGLDLRNSHELTMNMISEDWQFEILPTYDVSNLERSRFHRALDYALKVKNGEQSLFDLRKAKNDLFDLAKNARIRSNNSELNMD